MQIERRRVRDVAGARRSAGFAAGLWLLTGLVAPISAQDPAPGGASPTGALPPADLFGPSAPGANLPNEDAVILLAADSFVLHADGRIDHDRHRVIRLQSDFAIDQMGDPRVPYDTLYQEVVVHACRTYTPDGRVVEATPHAFNRNTPEAVAACPDEMHRQELVISHIGVERGCVIELDVEVRDRAPHAPWLEGIVFAREDYPVVRRVVSVKHPAGVRLNSAVVNGALQEEVLQGRFESEEGSAGGAPATIHVWRGENLPPAREGDDGAGSRLTRTHLVFSTCATWADLAARVRGDLEAAAPTEGSADAPLRAWLEEASREAATLTATDRARAILELTSTLIADASVTPFEAYRAPRPAARTFATACGNDGDRTALAAALLRLAGTDTEVALRPLSPRPAREVPALAQFDRVLLRADTGEALDPIGGKIFMRPEAWGGQPLLLTGAGERKARWLESATSESRAEVVVSLTLDEKGAAAGAADLVLSGRLYPYEEMTDLEVFLNGYAKRLLPGATVRSTEISDLSPSACRVRFSFAADTVTIDDNRKLHLPLHGGPVDLAGILTGFNLRRPARTTPIVLPCPLRESVTWRITLPQGKGAAYLPSPQAVQNEVGEFRLTVERGGEKGAMSARGRATHDGKPEPIVVRWTLALPSPEIAAERYPALRQLYGVYASENARLLIWGAPGKAKR